MRIEELITPLVFMSKAQQIKNGFDDDGKAVREIVEKAFDIFKRLVASKETGLLESAKSFIWSTYSYLKPKVSEYYALNKLAREIDLEWQTNMSSISGL